MAAFVIKLKVESHNIFILLAKYLAIKRRVLISMLQLEKKTLKHNYLIEKYHRQKTKYCVIAFYETPRITNFLEI